MYLYCVSELLQLVIFRKRLFKCVSCHVEGCCLSWLHGWRKKDPIFRGEFAHASLRTFKLKLLSSSRKATYLYSYGLLLLFIHLWNCLPYNEPPFNRILGITMISFPVIVKYIGKNLYIHNFFVENIFSFSSPLALRYFEVPLYNCIGRSFSFCGDSPVLYPLDWSDSTDGSSFWWVC